MKQIARRQEGWEAMAVRFALHSPKNRNIRPSVLETYMQFFAQLLVCRWVFYLIAKVNKQLIAYFDKNS